MTIGVYAVSIMDEENNRLDFRPQAMFGDLRDIKEYKAVRPSKE